MNWTPHNAWHLGGTLALGFSVDSRFLLVVSVNGRGLFDVQSGAKVARDSNYHDMATWYRQTEADGIGPCAGVAIRISGIGAEPLDAVKAALASFNVDDHITEFKGACISEDGRWLAVGYSDMVELYERK